jgi:SMC interacting uncharacterized protein involved in chromosome segregation
MPSKVKTSQRKNPGLSQAKAPTLIKATGERIVAQSELTQLQEKRDKLAAQLQEIDAQILEHKNKRKEELLAELHDLGLDVPTLSTWSRKGRPKGFKMSEEQKQTMRDGRAKAKAAREAVKAT